MTIELEGQKCLMPTQPHGWGPVPPGPPSSAAYEPNQSLKIFPSYEFSSYQTSSIKTPNNYMHGIPRSVRQCACDMWIKECGVYTFKMAHKLYTHDILT